MYIQSGTYFVIKGTLKKLEETEMEFVTSVTSSARVKFFWVKFTRIRAKNYPFCVKQLEWGFILVNLKR